MAGISNIQSKVYTPQVVAAQRPTVAAGGGVALPQGLDGDTLALGVRASTPVAVIASEHMGWLKNLLGKLFHHGKPPVPTPAPVPPAMSGIGMSGGSLAGAGGKIGSAFGNAMKTFGKALKSNFLVAGVMSLIGNGIELATGKVSAKRAITGVGVDTLAYTGIGASATTIGAMLGSLIPIPFVGTLLGVAAGLGLGVLYEKTVRKPAIDTVEQAIFKTTK